MLKLFICLLSSTVLGVFVLQLRQQQLELGHQTAQLHDQIRSRQARLWNQQLQIGVFTAPNAIERTVKGQQLNMVPVFGTALTARAIDPTQTSAQDAE